MDLTFYFVFWAALVWMVEYTLANTLNVLGFSWLVVFICAALLAYGTVWLNKQSS